MGKKSGSALLSLSVSVLLMFAKLSGISSRSPSELFCNHSLAISNPLETGQSAPIPRKDVLGICLSLNKSSLANCPILQQYLKSRDLKEWSKLAENFCKSPAEAAAENGENGQICCPLEGEGSYRENSEELPAPAVVDYQAHPNWKLFDSMFNEMKCGRVGIGDRIIGGHDAQLGQIPWMARIGYLLDDGSTLFTCSGTIITARYILTSAHCLNYWTQHGLELAPIRLAELNDSIDPELSSLGSMVHFQEFDIESLHIHPEYNPKVQGSHHDIALIRLTKDLGNLAKDLYIRAICLPFTHEYGIGEEELNEKSLARRKESPIYRGLIAGWGKVNNTNNNSSSTLQCLRVPIQKSVICQILYSATNFSASNQICVGGQLGKNSCWGDSGGPLIIPTTSGPGPRYFQVGIISYGNVDCGHEGIPGVYTKVKDYLSWILDTVHE